MGDRTGRGDGGGADRADGRGGAGHEQTVTEQRQHDDGDDSRHHDRA